MLDFHCPAARLAVEVDGATHGTAGASDARRTAWLAAQGVSIPRVRNNDVLANLPGVLETIAAALSERGVVTHRPAAPPPPSPLPQGEGE